MVGERLSNKKRRLERLRKKKIFDYWDENSIKLGSVKNGDDFGITESECFACGNIMQKLYRCHIIPSSYGGPNTVDNMHLLCSGCHEESEGLPKYWDWIQYKRANEWEWPQVHFHNWLKRQGIDVVKEAEYLTSINATQEKLNEHVKKLWNSIQRRDE